MSDDKVVPLGTITSLPIPVERVLQKAIEANLEEVIVVGISNNDDELYLAMSESDSDRLITLLEVAKARLLHVRMKRMGIA